MATVGDIYFVHQRGLRIAVINFILNSASSLSSIICGQVFQSLGWLWLFHMFQIFLVLQFVLMFLFCPETTYQRDERYNTDVVRDEKLQELSTLEHSHKEHVGEAGVGEQINIPKKKTFVQELAVWTGVYSRDNILKFLIGPFLTLLNPAGCYAVLASGLLNSWYVRSKPTSGFPESSGLTHMAGTLVPPSFWLVFSPDPRGISTLHISATLVLVPLSED